MATVSLDGVTKIYKGKTGDVCAVDRMCLDVSDREFVVLVGPSGCGKTTTLRLVAGLEAATAGTIRIGERVVNNVAPKDRDIAMVFQNYALYPHMTVFKNMAFGLKMRRVPKGEIKRKVHEVAGMLGIEQLLDRRPAALSGGERQRVAVGRAIVRRPQVFLFDEPLSNLDAKLRTHMRTEIKTLHRQLEATILYVTHDQEEAMTLGDRLVVMDGGVVQQCGTPLGVYNRPANRFVAGFIGRPAMNFLEGRLEAGSVAANGVCFIGSGGFRLDLAPDRARKLQPHVGQDAVLGVRPEHVELLASDTKTEPGSCGTVEFTISVVEPLGDRLHVHGVTPADEPLVVQAAATTGVEPGERRRLLIDSSQPHFFAADASGKRLDGIA